jgi:hypothetical protein
MATAPIPKAALENEPPMMLSLLLVEGSSVNLQKNGGVFAMIR